MERVSDTRDATSSCTVGGTSHSPASFRAELFRTAAENDRVEKNLEEMAFRK